MHPLLVSFLEPLQFFLETENLLEISVLREREVALEIAGKGYVFREAYALDYTYWKNLCHILANMNNLIFDPETAPLISTSFPDLKNGRSHRLEAMIYPSREEGISVSIRLKHPLGKSLQDFGIGENLIEKIKSLIERGSSVLISGGTSSGKTTLLNLLGHLIPLHKRILSVEDSREIDLPHQNWKSYLVSRNEVNTSVSYQTIIDHFMRSRPDIVMTGEVSVLNTFPIVRLLNTGHKGFMCTIHASSSALALEEAFGQNLQLAGMEVREVGSFLKRVIDLVIHVGHEEESQRKITEIWMPKRKEFMKLEL